MVLPLSSAVVRPAADPTRDWSVRARSAGPTPALNTPFPAAPRCGRR